MTSSSGVNPPDICQPYSFFKTVGGLGQGISNTYGNTSTSFTNMMLRWNSDTSVTVMVNTTYAHTGAIVYGIK